MKALPILKALYKISILLTFTIIFFSVFTGMVLAADTDGDGLADDKEVIFLTDPNDADSDDDGVLDGQEGLDTAKNPLHEDNDPDGDGFNNAVDADSDGDGILDGTEKGLTEADINITATDQSKGHFFPDQDPPSAHLGEPADKYITDPTKWDTDGDTLSDGDEDSNANGKYEPTQGETNPNFKDFDNDGFHDDTDDLDDDGDGMPDAFEKKYPNALNPLDPNDAEEDFDNDGFTNLREYLGNDNAPGNDDWSDPENPGSMPNVAPIVVFKSDEYITIGTEKVPRISVEAKQKIIFNDTLLKVTDENEKKGLNYIWDWGDGNTVTIYGVVPKEDKPTAHTYDTPGVYTIILQVEDDIKNMGEGKLNVDITHPIGGSEIVIDIQRDKDEFKDKKTIQRQGWIAYKIIDARNGDTITVDFTVEQKREILAELGVRVFVLPAKDFDTYKKNEPGTKVISRDYEEYWSGPVNSPSSGKKITIEMTKDETIYVVFDNRHYDEGEQHIVFDEPLEYKVSIEREESPVFIISVILIIIVVIVAGLMGGFFYLKGKRGSGVKKITREAAIETQRSLDREMVELELEIQDSLRRSTAAAPMQAMSLKRPTAPSPQPASVGTPATAPGTVPQIPAPVAGGGVVQPGQAPGIGAPAMPGSTPTEQPKLPAAGVVAPQPTAPPGQPGQPQLPPAQPGAVPPRPAPPQQPPAPAQAQQPPAQPTAPAPAPAPAPMQTPAPGQPPKKLPQA